MFRAIFASNCRAAKAFAAALIFSALAPHAQNPEAGMRAKLAASEVKAQAATGTSAPTHPNSGDLPELVGFTQTQGGNDGRVIHVTNLKSEGPGSLAEAVDAEGPRRIVFDVAGAIDLRNARTDAKNPDKSGGALVLRNPFVTIDGETAPNPGITLIRGSVAIATHDAIIRHIRVRPGENDQAKKSGWECDGIASVTGTHDVIVEHCSCEWATDENLSASGERFRGANLEEWRANTSHNVTFRYNIIAEGLSHATHRKDEHSKGTLIHDNTGNIALLGNLYASNVERNALFKGGARGVEVNNFIVNPGTAAIHYGLVPEEWVGHDWATGQLAIVNNVMQAGANTKKDLALMTYKRGPLTLFMEGNVALNADGTPAKTYKHSPTGGSPDQCEQVNTAPLWPADLKPWPADKVRDWVLENAGARPWDRDATDKRIVEQARGNTGKIIDSQTAVEGYGIPTPAPQ